MQRYIRSQRDLKECGGGARAPPGPHMHPQSQGSYLSAGHLPCPSFGTPPSRSSPRGQSPQSRPVHFQRSPLPDLGSPGAPRLTSLPALQLQGLSTRTAAILHRKWPRPGDDVWSPPPERPIRSEEAQLTPTRQPIRARGGAEAPPTEGRGRRAQPGGPGAI